MPKIGNGRVSTDGTGSISFKPDSQTIVAPTGGGANTALSVTGNSEGNGTPVFINQNSNVGNVVLNFASLSAGTNISFDTANPGNIIINATSGGGGGGVTEFIQLTDGPESYSNHSLLYSTTNSIAWTPAPSGSGQFLYYNGSTFAFTANVVTSVAATGTSGQITVSGSPITSSGTLGIGLAAVGTAGTYSTVTVDAYGRVVSGTSGGSSTVTLGGDVSGTGQTGSTITTTLATVQAGASYNTTSGIGVINSVDVKGRVTSSRVITLVDVTNIGGAPINSPTFTGTPSAPTPISTDNTTKIATTAFVVSQGYLKAPLVVTGDASGTSSGSSLALTLASVMTAGTYSTVTVDVKGRVIAGTQSSGGVTNVALTSPNSTITIAGSPITTSGTFNIDLPTVVVPGTYTSVTVDSRGRVVAGGAGGSGGTVTNVGLTSSSLVVSGSPITVSGTFDVELSVVATAGTYSSVTIDHFGRVISGVSGSGGTISNIGLISPASTLAISGSPLTANGTFGIDLATVSAAGTYSKVTVDAYGRVTGHFALTYADLPTEVQVSLMPFSFPGSPTASIDIIVPVVQSTTIPNGMTNTAGYALTAATASAVFTLSYIRSGTQTTIGTITFAASAHTPSVSYSLGSALSLIAGDVLVMTTPGSVDATLSNVGITVYTLKV